MTDWRVNKQGKLSAYVIDPNTGTEVEALWHPQPGSQQAFLACPDFEVLYEGTRGPGKTDALIMDFAQHCGKDDGSMLRGFGPEWRGILFRQTYPQLADVIAKTRKWLPQLFPDIKFNETKTTWVWPTGESLRLSYMQTNKDYWNYHGHQYPWIGWEELTTWPDSQCYTTMMSCCRSTLQTMPRKYRSTSNPYGPGHNWVKMRFRLPVDIDKVVGPRIEETGQPPRRAIHGYLDENKILLTADPTYKDRIRAAARNPAELAAWLDGSWDITAGGMFDDVWDSKVHVLPNFVVPHSWRYSRSFDWGSSKPFSVGWWVTSDGSDLRMPDGRKLSTVRGDLFRVYEWYGWNGEANVGTRMLAVDIAKGIIERELDWRIHNKVLTGPADDAIFKSENGVCIASDMSKPVRIGEKQYNGVRWIPAGKKPNSRKPGWEMMRSRLKASLQENGLPREKPGLFITERCEHFIRTIPTLPRDLNGDPDDVNTEAEDHIADEVRYRVWSSSGQTVSKRLIGVPS